MAKRSAAICSSALLVFLVAACQDRAATDFQRAADALDRGQFDSASALYQFFIESHPSSDLIDVAGREIGNVRRITETLRRASVLSDSGQLGEAKEALRIAASLHPMAVDTSVAFGMLDAKRDSIERTQRQAQRQADLRLSRRLRILGLDVGVGLQETLEKVAGLPEGVDANRSDWVACTAEVDPATVASCKFSAAAQDYDMGYLPSWIKVDVIFLHDSVVAIMTEVVGQEAFFFEGSILNSWGHTDPKPYNTRNCRIVWGPDVECSRRRWDTATKRATLTTTLGHRPDGSRTGLTKAALSWISLMQQAQAQQQ